MEGILHQLIGSLSQNLMDFTYLKDFIYPKWWSPDFWTINSDSPDFFVVNSPKFQVHSHDDNEWRVFAEVFGVWGGWGKLLSHDMSTSQAAYSWHSPEWNAPRIIFAVGKRAREDLDCVENFDDANAITYLPLLVGVEF